MMDSVREYLLRLVAAAMLCSAVSGLIHTAATKGIVKLLCGLVMTVTVLSPLRSTVLSLPEEIGGDLRENMENAVAAGEDLSREALRQGIIRKTEAYIQDKANRLGAAVSVEVTLSGEDPPVPESVRINGSVSPAVKRQLQTLLETELAITKENQQWTG